jgi:hypothetical protein
VNFIVWAQDMKNAGLHEQTGIDISQSLSRRTRQT